jgi:hypothetical protein
MLYSDASLMGHARVLSLPILAGGLAAIVWACFAFGMHDSQRFCLTAAAGTALCIFGSSIGRLWFKAALWLISAIAGHAVMLQLIDAGRSIHYQHYSPLTRPGHSFLLGFVALQTILVAVGLKAVLPPVWTWMRRHLGFWPMLAAGAVFFLSSAAVSREIPSYVAEACFAAFLQLVNLANIVLVAANLPAGTLASLRLWADKWFPPAEQPAKIRLDRFALAVALLVAVLAGALSFFVYERHPHIPDEVVYLYHARYFAAGMVTMPPPPAADAFNIDLMTYERERWFCPVPPGWPAMLALGVFLGGAWLVNPILGGLNILLAYLILQELYSLRIARWCILLLCLSPWYVFMAMNFLTHTFTLSCALGAACLLLRSRRTGQWIPALAAGMAIGMGSLIRPLDGLIVAVLLGALAIGLGGPRLNMPGLVALAAGTVLIGAITLPYNKLLTGNATRAPLMAYIDKYYGPHRNDLGFGPNRGLGWALDAYPGHTPFESLINDELNAASINAELFGWSTGSLLLAILMVFCGALGKSDRLMLSGIAVVLGAYSLYWFSGGPDFGARYWYLVIVPCVVLTARGIQFLQEKCAPGAGGDMRVLAAVACLCLLAAVNYLPWRASDKYYHYLRMRPDVPKLSQQYHFGRSLVLVRGQRHPDYASAAIYNPLDLHADAPIYVWDRGPEARAHALEAYPDRPVWFIEGPTITHAGFRVAAGPVAARDVNVRQASACAGCSSQPLLR